jgi:putative endonuclease
MYHVYILHSAALNKFYIGTTADIEMRLFQHNSVAQGFTRTGRPWRIVYAEDFETKMEALKREKYLKRMKSHRFIEELVHTSHHHQDD